MRTCPRSSTAGIAWRRQRRNSDGGQTRPGRRHRRAGQGDADRHDDQAAAGGGSGGPAGRRQPGPAAGIHERSIKELETGLTPELRDELERLSLPFTEDTIPSDGELRIAQAQLVGWLEGVFHGLQAALVAQQMAARVQLEQMRRGALPPGPYTGRRAERCARRRTLRDRSVPLHREAPLSGTQLAGKRSAGRPRNPCCSAPIGAGPARAGPSPLPPRDPTHGHLSRSTAIVGTFDPCDQRSVFLPL